MGIITTTMGYWSCRRYDPKNLGHFDFFFLQCASVYSEKTRRMMKMIIISIMNKPQGKMVFHGRQKLTSAMKQRPEK